MLPHEVITYYKTRYVFNKCTKINYNTINMWLHQGYIPLDSQVKLERLTNGDLKARFEDGKKYD